MIKIFLLYITINSLLVLSGFAQVGIKTSTPLGVFHIDAGVTGSTADDVIVDSQGRVGIGTIAPSTKLHIKTPVVTPSIAIKDGNQRSYKMLTSNAQGVGTWKFAGYDIVKGTLSSEGKTFLVSSIPLKAGYPSERDVPLYPLDGTITLPPGRWCLYANFLISTTGSNATDTYESNTWIRLTYSDTYSGPSSPDIVGAPWISGPVYAIPFGVVQGFIVILNRTSEPKTYYLGIVYANQGMVSAGVQITNLASNAKGENGIVAVKIANN